MPKKGGMEMATPTMHIPEDNKLTTQQAAQICGRTTNTIRQWAHRGILLPNGARYHLRPVGIDQTGAKLYDLRDLAIINNALKGHR